MKIRRYLRPRRPGNVSFSLQATHEVRSGSVLGDLMRALHAAGRLAGFGPRTAIMAATVLAFAPVASAQLLTAEPVDVLNLDRTDPSTATFTCWGL